MSDITGSGNPMSLPRSGDDKPSIRVRLGVWLLRPYIKRVGWHYEETARRLNARGEHVRAERCEYMAIGLGYARSPLTLQNPPIPKEYP